MLSNFWNMENWSILVFLDCRSHVRYIFSWTIDKWIILHVIHWSIWDFSDWIQTLPIQFHAHCNWHDTTLRQMLWRFENGFCSSVKCEYVPDLWKFEKSFKWVQSAHCHVYLLSSWHPIVLASQLFHSCIVSARRTLFEPPLTLSLSHWHWPRVWDQPTLRDFTDCLHAYIATVRAMWQTWYLSTSLH